MAHDIVTACILIFALLAVPLLIIGDILAARRFARDAASRREAIRAEYDSARATVRDNLR